MSVTSAQIKQKFKTYFGSFSYSFTPDQLDAIFAKAELYYFDGLTDRYILNSEVATDLSTVILAFQVSPGSNEISTSTLADYYRILRIKPTYIQSGVTYDLFSAKPMSANNRMSPYSQGSLTYPVYDEIQDKIRLFPSAYTPTVVVGEYVITPPVISFQTADLNTPISITTKNMEEIIKMALVQCGVSVRENDYAAAIAQENKSE